MRYQPPLTLTPAMVSLVAEDTLRLRRINRIRTIQGSSATAGSPLMR